MRNEIEIKLPIKFSSVNFKKFIADFWDSDKSIDRIILNFTDSEWFTLEGKIFLMSFCILKKREGCNFFIKLPSPVNTENDNREWFALQSNLLQKKTPLNIIEERKQKFFSRKIKRRIQFYKIFFIEWKFLKDTNINSSAIIENSNIDRYITFEQAIDSLKVIPFQIINCNHLTLNNKQKINEVENGFEMKMQEITRIDSAISKQLEQYSLISPFQSKIMSNVIANELILNVALHAYQSENQNKECFFAVQLNTPNKNYNPTTFKSNFIGERTIEQLDFFTNEESNLAHKSFLEITLIDFGVGIPYSLREQYQRNKDNNKFVSKKEADQILEYAFEITSSRNSFIENINVHELIPRGLFFLIEVIRFYSGSLLVRSREGRLLFDFSDLNNPIKVIQNDLENYNFPGTLYNILLPDTKHRKNPLKIKGLELTKVANTKFEFEAKHLLIVDLQNEIIKYYSREKWIAGLIGKIDEFLNELHKTSKRYIVYIDFAAANTIFIDFKIFYYLCNTPKIDRKVNVIIVNYPSDKSFLETLSEIQTTISKVEPFIFKPIPCLFFGEPNKNGQEDIYQIKWIGIKKDENEKLLNEIIRYGKDEEDVKSVREFISPDTIDTNLLEIEWIDRRKGIGNVKISKSTILPKLNNFSFRSCLLGNEDFIIRNLIVQDKLYDDTKDTAFNGIKRKDKELEILKNADDGFIYLTSGGYYQFSFIKFLNALNDEKIGKRFAKYLLNKYLFERGKFPEINAIVSVTLSSSLLAEYIREEYAYKKGLEKKERPKLIALSHYSEFQKESTLELLNENDKVILVNDVISTGKLVSELVDSIELTHKAKIEIIFSLMDIRTTKNDITEEFLKSEPRFKANLDYGIIYSDYKNNVERKIISLTKYKVLKMEKNPTGLIPVRINPIINSPETESNDITLKEHVLIDTNEIIDIIGDEHIKVGHIKNNHHYHYYTIDTGKLFQSQKGISLIHSLVSKIASKKNKASIKYDTLIYPLFSPVDEITKHEYKYEIFSNPEMDIFPIPRVNTETGWRIPLTNIFKFYELPNDKKLDVFIFDDGSCSGDTIIQLIDLISLSSPLNSITVLSIFGRLEAFEREFLSRISKLKVSPNMDSVEINIFFGIQLYIPFFTQQNCHFLQEENRINFLLKDEKNKNETINNLLKGTKEYLKSTNVSDSNAHRFTNIFPLRLNGDIPVKEMFYLRNVIGKIQGFRIFEEYYTNIETDFKNQESLEVTIGILNLEPYLANILKINLPDIYQRLLQISVHILNSLSFTFNSVYKFKPYAIFKFITVINIEKLINPNIFINAIKYIENLENEIEKKQIYNLFYIELRKLLDSNLGVVIQVLLNNLIEYSRKQNLGQNYFFTLVRHLNKVSIHKSDFQLRNTISGFQDDINNMHVSYNHPTISYLYNSVIVYLTHIEHYKEQIKTEISDYLSELSVYKQRIEIIRDFCNNHKTCVSTLFNKFDTCYKDIETLEIKFKKIINKDFSTRHIDNSIQQLEKVQSYFTLSDTGGIYSFFREYPVNPYLCINDLVYKRSQIWLNKKMGFETVIDAEKVSKNIFCLINKEFLQLIIQELITNAQKAYKGLNASNKPDRLEITFFSKSDNAKGTELHLVFRQNFDIINLDRDFGLIFIEETLKGFGGGLATYKDDNKNTAIASNEIYLTLNKYDERKKTSI